MIDEEKRLFEAWIQASNLERGLDLLEWLEKNAPEVYEDIASYYDGIINSVSSW